MTINLIPLWLNELLCRPLIVSFNFRDVFSRRFIQLTFRSDAKRHNARINRARARSIQAASEKMSMKELLSSAPVE
jgi:hypothetical protein